MFSSKSQLNTTGTGQKLDASQIGKLGDFGLQTTVVSDNPSVLSQTVPISKQVAPGVKVEGFQDSNGSFYVVDSNNNVHSVNTAPTLPNGGGLGTGPTSPNIGGGNEIPRVPNVNTPTTPVFPNPPSGNGGTTLPPPPPPNLGSGKIWTLFDSGDIVPNQQEIITRAMWSGNVGNLLTFYTGSQTAISQRYYYSIYNSGSGDCGAQPQFAVAWGHKQGSGSADEGGQINDTPSRAIYGQYKQLCLDSETDRFVIGGNATDSIYIVNINRARMREYVDEGNLELNLEHMSGSKWLQAGRPQNAWTGSNVKTLGEGLSNPGRIIRLIDDSRVESATIGHWGERYNIVSGSLEDGIYNSSNPHYYGLLYKRLGIVILDGNVLDMSASFLTVTGSEIPGDNAWKLFKSISGSARYTDASGDYLGFQARSAEKVKSTHYFVRVKNQDYNFSNNPTFTTGSEGDLAEPTFIGDPQVYLTTVGLYNPAKELLAVAKLNRAIKKNFSSEALIKVKLEFVFAAVVFALNFI